MTTKLAATREVCSFRRDLIVDGCVSVLGGGLCMRIERGRGGGRWEAREGGEGQDDPKATCYLVQQQIECDLHILDWTSHLFLTAWTCTLHTQSLSKELEKRKSSLLAISEKLQPITAVLSPDEHQSVRDLLLQVERNTKCVLQIENGLRAIEIGQKSHSSTSSRSRPPQKLLDVPPVQNGWGHQTPPVPKSAGQDTRSLTPPGLYATLDEVMAPPSPLVEYEQVGAMQLMFSVTYIL